MNRLALATGLLIASATVIAQDNGWPSPPFKKASADASTCPRPEYPEPSLLANEEGKVLLRFLIDPKGQIIREQVARSSGHARLDQAALDALRRCKFIPFNAADGPAESVAVIEYVWRIKPPVRYLAVASASASGCQPPRAPAESNAEGAKGATRLALTLSAEGWVESARVESTSGSFRLDSVALAAYSLCRFRSPPEADGVNVKGMVNITHAWQ